MDTVWGQPGDRSCSDGSPGQRDVRLLPGCLPTCLKMVHDQVSAGHRHDQQRTHDPGRRRGGNAGRTAQEAKGECQKAGDRLRVGGISSSALPSCTLCPGLTGAMRLTADMILARAFSACHRLNDIGVRSEFRGNLRNEVARIPRTPGFQKSNDAARIEAHQRGAKPRNLSASATA